MHSQTPIDQVLRQQFLPETTGGGIHNPYLSIDHQQQIAVANNQGLLLFDGSNWERINLPNGTQSRSVWAHEGVVYCGGQGFLGIYRSSVQDAPWHDLSDVISTRSGPFTDVWRMFGRVEDSTYQVVFSTSEFVGSLNQDGEYTEWTAGDIENAIETPEGIGVQSHLGLSFFDNHGRSLANFPIPHSSRVEGFIWSHDDARHVLLTHQSGIFVWNGQEWEPDVGPLSQHLKRVRVNCLLAFEGQTAIGTSESGILFTSNFQTYQRGYDVQSGLVSNTILDMRSDDFGNLWASMEGGIELFRYSWPHRIPHRLPKSNLVGYSSLHRADGSVYWGTSQSLWYQTSNQGKATEVTELIGPIWSLQTVDGDTWVAHPQGAGFLIGSDYFPLIEGEGCWNIWPSATNQYWYVGTYQGIIQVEHHPGAKDVAGRWNVSGPLGGFEESVRFLGLDEDGQTWWATHPYRGAYQFRIDAVRKEVVDLSHYVEDQGFPSPLSVNLCRVDGAIRFATQAGFYRYDSDQDRMVPDRGDLTQWTQEDGAFQRMIADPTGGLWIFQGTEISHIPLGGRALLKNQELGIAPMQKSRPVAPFESIEFMPNGLACVPVEHGFIYLDPERMLRRDNVPDVQLKRIRHLNAGNLPILHPGGTIQLEAGSHALEFQLTSLNSNWIGIQHYQWRIEDVSNEWSTPSPSPIINISSLEPGSHRIEFRSIVNEGLSGPAIEQLIEIAPFWYQRPLVQVGISMLILGAFFTFVHRNRRILKAEHALEQESQRQQRREAERALQASIRAREEELQREREATRERQLSTKNKELASASMNLVQKAQLLQSLENGLRELQSLAPNQQGAFAQQLIRIIHDGGKLDDAWEQFTEQFDQVHVEFQHRLTDQFPHLTKNDLKLCTYLRMNLSSKEIATLMFITVRAVEVSRSRLRKRLGLSKEQGLTQFIQSI